MGLNCSQLTFCHSSDGQPIFVDTRRLATCSCNVVRWKCDYDPCPAKIEPKAFYLVVRLGMGVLDLDRHSFLRKLQVGLSGRLI